MRGHEAIRIVDTPCSVRRKSNLITRTRLRTRLWAHSPSQRGRVPGCTGGASAGGKPKKGRAPVEGLNYGRLQFFQEECVLPQEMPIFEAHIG